VITFNVSTIQKDRIAIVFEDQFGVSYAKPVIFTWAPMGQTSQLKLNTRFRRETSTMAGLTISGKIYKRHFNTRSMSKFCWS